MQPDLESLVPRGTSDRLDALAAMIIAENARQNLVSPSTLSAFRHRHIYDSLQLLPLAPQHPDSWVDIGSGGGLPGLVIAVASSWQVTLVEPRKLRAEFLSRAAQELQCDNVKVVQRRAEALTGERFEVISARAVAPLPSLMASAIHLAAPSTRWLLPKGRSAADELATAAQTWQGQFEIVPSRTDPAAGIIVASNVRRRRERP